MTTVRAIRLEPGDVIDALTGGSFVVGSVRASTRGVTIRRWSEDKQALGRPFTVTPTTTFALACGNRTALPTGKSQGCPRSDPQTTTRTMTT